MLGRKYSLIRPMETFCLTQQEKYLGTYVFPPRSAALPFYETASQAAYIGVTKTIHLRLLLPILKIPLLSLHIIL